MPNNEAPRRLPVKLILSEDRDLKKPHGGGSRRRRFNEVTPSLRKSIVKQVKLVFQAFRRPLRDDLPVVARVSLEEKALAKSHRPSTLFSKNTCPIIGTDGAGVLLVSATAAGLRRLCHKILIGQGDDIEADISTISSIEPYTEECKVEKLGRERNWKLDTPLQLRIFNHRNSALMEKLNSSLKESMGASAIFVGQGIGSVQAYTRVADDQVTISRPVYRLSPFGSDQFIFRIDNWTPSIRDKLLEFVGTQSLSPMAAIQLASTISDAGPVTPERFPRPDPDREYPIVGLLDTGTDPSIAALQEWVVERDEEDVPAVDQENSHGTFVAGMIVNGRSLNNGDPRFPSVQSKIVDVVVYPKTSKLFVDDFLRTVRRVVEKYHGRVKVWNISLSVDRLVCSDDTVSPLAAALDEIQDKYDVIFVICAGNCTETPLRGWPTSPMSEQDRISPPADSFRAITVGSVAHVARSSSVVKVDHPSPFSRRGPGPCFIPKPEVCHYGGNCDSGGSFAGVGVCSIGGNGIVEAIGTSFSTPLVASLLANVVHASHEPMSCNLVKALTIHSAALNSRTTNAAELKYRGFGLPSGIETILECEPWRATMVFEPEIPVDRRIFSKLDFPIPDCFRTSTGGIKGGVLLTVVYDPPLSQSGGFEYCQANVEVSLGSYDAPEDGEDPEHLLILPMTPKDMGKLGERALIEEGFKWSPVKVYQHEFRDKGVERTRLYARLFLRDQHGGLGSQRVAIVASVYDAERKLPVYADTMAAIQSNGWQSVDLTLRSDVRVRVRR